MKDLEDALKMAIKFPQVSELVLSPLAVFHFKKLCEKNRPIEQWSGEGKGLLPFMGVKVVESEHMEEDVVGVRIGQDCHPFKIKRLAELWKEGS